jgi:hypothetical protein
MEDRKEIFISLNLFLDTLDLDAEKRLTTELLLVGAEVLREDFGIQHISPLAYSKFTLATLDESRQHAEKAQSLDAVHKYRDIGKGFLSHWITMADIALISMFGDPPIESRLDMNESIKTLIDCMQSAYEHFVRACELTIKSDPNEESAESSDSGDQI